MVRPQTVIPESPIKPFPFYQSSTIISGFGRGSSELGIPTANVPINDQLNDLQTGVYFGWCKLSPNATLNEYQRERKNGKLVQINNGHKLTEGEKCVLPMVMSVGWNPFYDNKEKAAEVHVIQKFNEDFYGATIEYNILGFIRPELDYTTKEALIADINRDIEIAQIALEKDSYKTLRNF